MRWFFWKSTPGTAQGTDPPNGVEINWPVFRKDALSLLDGLIDELRDKIDDEIEAEIGDRKIISTDDVSVSFQRCAAKMANELGQKLVQHARVQEELLEARSVDDMMSVEYTDRIEEAL